MTSNEDQYSVVHRLFSLLTLCIALACGSSAWADATVRFATAPEQGLKRARVIGLAQHIRDEGMTLDPLSGTFSAKHGVRNFLLLADGSVRKGWPQGVPLEDFNAAASRQAEPQLWGTFEARTRPGAERTYEIRWRDGKTESLALSFLVLAQSDERLNGFFARVNTAQSGGAAATTFANAWRGIAFRPDGRFETSRGGGVDYANESARMSASDQQRSRGRYRLSGNVLELRFDDGKVQRQPFAFSSAKKDWIYIDGQRMLLRK